MCNFCSDDEDADRKHKVKYNPSGEDEAFEKARDEGKFDEPEEDKI